MNWERQNWKHQKTIPPVSWKKIPTKWCQSSSQEGCLSPGAPEVLPCSWSLSTAPLEEHEHRVLVWSCWGLPPPEIASQSFQLCSGSPTLHQLWASQQDEPQHFLKCSTSVLPERLELHLLSMLRRRKEEFKSNTVRSVYDIWVPTHRNPTSPAPQAPTEDPTTWSRFKFVKWFLFSLIFCECYTTFPAGNLHSEFSGTGQVISDSCSEMQDLVTCSTIKLPRASSSLLLIFVRTPPLLHRQQPIFRVLPLPGNVHQEYQTYVPTKTAP